VLAVGRRKQLKLRRVARAWLATTSGIPSHSDLRFDVVGIRIDRAGRVADYEHIKGAF
jgi:Holliday junction resolvase-like predicted endonuclease